uniref:Late blight resistance protein homolog R1B-16 n=1 Tax=Solanum tuberosum TaxID=4113 RepID=M1B1V2_SOLTU
MRLTKEKGQTMLFIRPLGEGHAQTGRWIFMPNSWKSCNNLVKEVCLPRKCAAISYDVINPQHLWAHKSHLISFGFSVVTLCISKQRYPFQCHHLGSSLFGLLSTSSTCT